ncbi:MAG: hypothetical protein K2X55_28675, partial [Burkholderiaceae bacterium]|nr:hypothetical protein [Burkholderiaceae bacterium]
MQTPLIPNTPSTGATTPGNRTSAAIAAGTDGLFSQTLSRQMDQRQAYGKPAPSTQLGARPPVARAPQPQAAPLRQATPPAPAKASVAAPAPHAPPSAHTAQQPAPAPQTAQPGATQAPAGQPASNAHGTDTPARQA